MSPADTHVINALEAEAAKVKRTTCCTVTRTFIPKKKLKSAKRQKDIGEETCQCLVSDEPFDNSSGTTKNAQAGIDVRGLCLPQL